MKDPADGSEAGRAASARPWRFMDDIAFDYPGQGSGPDGAGGGAGAGIGAGLDAVKVDQDTNGLGAEEARGSGEILPRSSQEYELSSRPVKPPSGQHKNYPAMPPVNAHSYRQLEQHASKRSRHHESLSQQILKQQQSRPGNQHNLRHQHYQGVSGGAGSDTAKAGTGLSGTHPSSSSKQGSMQPDHWVDASSARQKVQRREVHHVKQEQFGIDDQQSGKGSSSEREHTLSGTGCTKESNVGAPEGMEQGKSGPVHLHVVSQPFATTESILNVCGARSDPAREGVHSGFVIVGSSTDDAADMKPSQPVKSEVEPVSRAVSGRVGHVGGGALSLREWLNRPSRVLDRVEGLHIFRQILEFVNLAHRQGVILRNVRPSCFLLSSLNRVGFIESASTRGSSERSSERSTGISSTPPVSGDHGSHGGVAGVRQGQDVLVGAHSEGVGGYRQRTTVGATNQTVTGLRQAGVAGSGSSASACSRDMHSHQTDSSGGRSDIPNMLASPGDNAQDCFPQRQLLLMEQTWYSSPEELAGGAGSFASDTYRLGVLFFELLCIFSSPMERSRVMSDLRHRILPPRLLSECPKEAAFCLWLLHPEPNSRPKAGEILNCELLSEAREALAERQAAVGIEEREAESDLLLDFLVRLQQQKQEVAQKSSKDIHRLLSDIKEVERRRSVLKSTGIPGSFLGKVEHLGKLPSPEGKLLGLKRRLDDPCVKGLVDLEDNKPGILGKRSRDTEEEKNIDLKLKNIATGDGQNKRPTELSAKSARLMNNFSQLERVYFSMRWKSGTPTTDLVSGSGHPVEAPAASAGPQQNTGGADAQKSAKGQDGDTSSDDSEDWLGCFFDNLCKYARYSRFEVKATLRHGDLLNTANMVCSLSFDRDDEFFATAGVCKRIKVFECDAVLNEHVDIHYPVVEMTSRSKLSSVCWNSYIKSHIASSDYEGVVQLWDANTSQTVMEYEEHEKRAWSVDFSHADPTKLASGSDDGCVKLWSINQETSIGTIKTKANVCCVQFPDDSAHLLAFGSADYRIFCYDLRNTKMPLCILANHNKAVSYVKFVDSGTLVSASTDNTLKLWDITKASAKGGVTTACSLTYTGHTNEKNFVGLTVADGYIACGAETNAVYAYHKSLPMPMASHRFGCADPVTGQETEDDGGQFVSSVCWRGRSHMLVAANSMGNIKFLELM